MEKIKKKKKKIYVLKVLTKGVKNVLLLSVACDMFSVVVRTQVSINYYKIGVYKRVIILKSRLGLKHITERLGDISTSTSWVLDWFGKTILQKVKEQHIYSSTFGVVYRAKHWDKHIIYNIRNGYTYGEQIFWKRNRHETLTMTMWLTLWLYMLWLHLVPRLRSYKNSNLDSAHD